jgi:hypothetical protein
MRSALLVLASASVLLGQPDPRELVRQSTRNGERSWRRSFDYYCTKRDVERQLDSAGRIRAVDDDVYQVIPLGDGASYERPVEHNTSRSDPKCG